MARTSSTNARAAGGGTRRRAAGRAVRQAEAELVDRPGEMAAGGAGPEDRCSMTDRTCAEGDGAGMQGGTVADRGAEACGGDGRGLTEGVRRWLVRARGLGLTVPELVFELHVRQGLALLEVARVLGLDVEAVQEHWLLGRAARAERAPQSEADFAALREHISAALWQTVEATFPNVLQAAEDDEDAEPPAPPSPPMLSVRLKALDQIAKLYDLSLETRASGLGPLPYATPEDIALSVRERVLEMHGREGGMKG